MSNPSSPLQRQRRLILHAGTHKTASTDIQSRLLRSRDLLAQQNLQYRFPTEDVSHFKSLSHAITHGNWNLWHDYLKRMGPSDADVLVSAEQFAPRLTQRKTIRTLQSIAEQHNYRLTVVIFIRSQLDYINSRYAYTLKRFYHTTTFPEYIDAVLKGDLPSSGSFKGPNAKRSDVFDFWNYFSALLKERASGLDVRFIPFRQTHPDPFIQFLHSLELDPSLPWAEHRESSLNSGTGPRGTWLARELSQRLRHHGISPRAISGSTTIIPKETAFRGWDDGKF